jgi:hypothetical protein
MDASDQSPRRLDRWDGAILGVAAVVAVLLMRFPEPLRRFDPRLAQDAIEVSRPFLMAWTTALLVVRLRRPRPSWRRLSRQPGMAACGIATLVVLVHLTGIVLVWALAQWWPEFGRLSPPTALHSAYPLTPFGGTPPPPSPPLRVLWLSSYAGFISSAHAGHGVAGAWLNMALGGWWRPERSGIDRLGRALGAAWIAVMVAGFVASFME